METFYDGDLKDIWDSDLDPTESLKISTDTDMHDWFLERDVKDSAVILNDKLISDAILNGTLPIKSEHSYSLNSDGDSLPNSPSSLHTKMDDMEDECYPAISLKAAISNNRHMDTGSIDPKCLTILPHATTVTCSPIVVTSFAPSSSLATPASSTPKLSGPFASNSVYGGLNKITASTPLTLNLRNLADGNASNIGTGVTSIGYAKYSLAQTHTQSQLQQQQQQQQQQQSQQYIPQQLSSNLSENDCCSPASTRDGSTSPDICSDIEIDESCIKDEPVSPDSSCPPSPNSTQAICARANQNAALSLNIANVAASFSNSDLVLEHKNGCLQLTPASQNFLKSQQLILSTSSSSNSQNILMPKFNMKNESPIANSSAAKSINGIAYGLPLTPPSSLSSDDSEGNLTPEHLLSPLSPNTSVTITMTSATAGSGVNTVVRRGSNISNVATATVNCLNAVRNTVNGVSGSTRQPIHTPLISSQPKGSTGTLILTEEEKRTLLAEGYPIPQKLPLTKAEEKSLKKIRRKIKNKISAQESRRKKKEYMDQLERRVEILVNENNDYRKRVESLEDSNASLLSQLHKLQTLLSKQNAKKS